MTWGNVVAGLTVTMAFHFWGKALLEARSASPRKAMKAPGQPWSQASASRRATKNESVVSIPQLSGMGIDRIATCEVMLLMPMEKPRNKSPVSKPHRNGLVPADSSTGPWGAPGSSDSSPTPSARSGSAGVYRLRRGSIGINQQLQIPRAVEANATTGAQGPRALSHRPNRYQVQRQSPSASRTHPKSMFSRNGNRPPSKIKPTSSNTGSVMPARIPRLPRRNKGDGS